MQKNEISRITSCWLVVHYIEALQTSARERWHVDVVVPQVAGLHSQSLEVALHGVHGDQAEMGNSQ